MRKVQWVHEYVKHIQAVNHMFVSLRPPFYLTVLVSSVTVSCSARVHTLHQLHFVIFPLLKLASLCCNSDVGELIFSSLSKRTVCNHDRVIWEMRFLENVELDLIEFQCVSVACPKRAGGACLQAGRCQICSREVFDSPVLQPDLKSGQTGSHLFGEWWLWSGVEWKKQLSTQHKQQKSDGKLLTRSKVTQSLW